MNTDLEFLCFCQNVRRLRTEAGLSQKEMAQIMGIGVYSLRKIELRMFPPRAGVDMFFRLRHTFHISIVSLFTAANETPEGK